MRIPSSHFVQLATRVYQPLVHLTTNTPVKGAPALPRMPAACVDILNALRRDERVTNLGAVIALAETPMVVRLLGGFVDVRKGVALGAPLEGLAVTPRGVETLVAGRPQGIQPIALFDTFDDPEAFRVALDTQLTALYEDCRKLKVTYFAPKNALAAFLMRVPDEM